MTARPVVAGIAISHPERALWPDDGITKIELARYYGAIAEWIVPHVRRRPLTLLRCEGSIDDCKFLRHGRAWGPSALERVNIREKHKVGEYLVANDRAGVIALAQLDIVEIHTWNSTADDVEHPDRLVVDLDPGDGVAWRDVVAAARRVRAALHALGLPAWVKTTGGAGLHVVVPLRPAADWSRCLEVARQFCAALARAEPARFTTLVGKQHRRGKIYLDYLRNNRTNTSVCAFSTRARPGAPVSMPLSWSSLGRVDPRAFTLRTVPKLLARRRRDPWASYFTSGAILPS
ncbi:MAG TPA: non-homologous end-joining DNA ligase [Polyangia bacterium]|jgi:bifunctional non-homologous end joining protein LigD